MAQMHPAAPDPGTPHSERKVFEALATGLPDDWTVLHGRRIVIPAERGRPPVEGESDFLVIDPRRGCAILEVKGGQAVGRDRDGWYSIDARGTRHAIKDPSQQVQRIMHTTKRYLEDQRGCPFRGNQHRLAWGVVFPDFAVRGDVDPALPRAMVIDHTDLADPVRAIGRIMDAHGVEGRDLPAGTTRFVVETLRPCFRLVRSLSTSLDDQEKALVQLTDEQAHILEFYADNPRVGVRGVAGSGKTLIAIEKARRLAAAGKRVLFLCFNQPLARHLARCVDDVRVATFHAWCLDTVKAAGLSSRIPRERDDSFFDETAPQLLLEALQRLPDERWDAIVVDEGQDFLEPWWIPIDEALRRDNPILYVFWDPNQDLYGGGPTEALGLVPARLDYNCRNTRRIAEFASAHVGAEPKFRPGTPDGDDVLRITATDERDMTEQVRKLLHRFVREENIAADRIVVLSPLGEKRSAVRRAGKLGPFTLVDLDVEVPGPTEIRFSTVHRFKGLEADVVILCEVDAATAARPELMHVGSSRAKHFLAVVART